MIKKRNNKLVFSSVIFHIFILICGIFSFVILFGDIVSGVPLTLNRDVSEVHSELQFPSQTNNIKDLKKNLPPPRGAPPGTETKFTDFTDTQKLGGYIKPGSQATAHLYAGINWALFVLGAVELIGSFIGLEQNEKRAIEYSLIGGGFAYQGAKYIGKEGILGYGKGSKFLF